MKSDFLPVKKTKKLPVKKNNVGVKNLKNGPKSGREKRKLPVKKIKKMPKIGFTGTFYFHGKKKHWSVMVDIYHSTSSLLISKIG